MTYQRHRGNIAVSEDDEENEEIMRANRNTVSSNSNMNHNPPMSKPKFDNSKSAADNWKGIGNRHMASQVRSDLDHLQFLSN